MNRETFAWVQGQLDRISERHLELTRDLDPVCEPYSLEVTAQVNDLYFAIRPLDEEAASWEAPLTDTEAVDAVYQLDEEMDTLRLCKMGLELAPETGNSIHPEGQSLVSFSGVGVALGAAAVVSGLGALFLLWRGR